MPSTPSMRRHHRWRHRWRNRWHISAEQRERLDAFLREEAGAAPEAVQIEELARRLGMSPTRAKIWFQSRRHAEATRVEWYKNRRARTPCLPRLVAVLACTYVDARELSLPRAVSDAWEVIYEHARSMHRARRIIDAAVYAHINAHSAMLLLEHPSLTAAETHSLAVRALSERCEALARWV